MATISHLSLLFFFTLTISVHAKLNLDTADHHAIFMILKDLGVLGELPRPDNLCNAAGIFCEPRISKESRVLKVTRIVFKTQRLRGFLSPAIGQLSELKELSFPNNYLVDHIPPQVAHCRKLEVLDVGNNKLSGEIPGDLSSLFHLRILNFSSNLFSGDLSFLNYLPNLEKLSLDDNLFTGKVPLSLFSFRNLRFFNISGNSLVEGPLPALNQLESLSLEPKKTNYNRVRKRYMLAELTKFSTNETGNKSSGSNSPQAPAPVPSSMETINNKHTKTDRNQSLAVIVVAGIISPTIFSMLFLLIVTMMKDISHKNKKIMMKEEFVQTIFSPLIKAKELAFLNDDKKVEALQVIGRGGCGEVYKKVIAKGKTKTFAIKRIIQRQRDAKNLYSEFLAYKWRQMRSEITTVGQIRHRNLLPLLAQVSAPTCSYLVYEFIKNGSLEDNIQQANNGTRELNWPLRHKIAVGVASGLEYLHMVHKPRIVHLDLKPANILLDDNMEALITDFGLAQFIPDGQDDKKSWYLGGTFGYIAPEYRQSMRFDDKCDIYSFGVLLAVLVMGKFPSDEFFQHTSEMSMVRWMRMVLSSDNPKQAIDPQLLGNGYDEQMLLVLKIACSCTLDKPGERPNSTECRLMLTEIIS